MMDAPYDLRTEALNEIADIVRRYLPPDSGITPNDALSEIIGVVDSPHITPMLTLPADRLGKPLKGNEGKTWPALVPGAAHAGELVAILRRVLGEWLKPDTPYDDLYQAVAAIAMEINIRNHHQIRSK